MAALLVEEQRTDLSIPFFELPGWEQRFGVVAGITARGSLTDPFDLGLVSEQPTRRVLERWRALRAALPDFHSAIIARQVHGTTVLWHGPTRGWVVLEGADGHATSEHGVLLTVSVADCIPIYLVDPAVRAVGLLHAGWRGTAAGIVREGIQTLTRSAKSSVENLVMHCGVGVCGRCYEVGSEVAVACGGPVSISDGKHYLDLRQRIEDQAAREGIRSITVSPYCSAHDSDRFFSHRASGGADGRMVACLGLRHP